MLGVCKHCAKRCSANIHQAELEWPGAKLGSLCYTLILASVMQCLSVSSDAKLDSKGPVSDLWEGAVKVKNIPDIPGQQILKQGKSRNSNTWCHCHGATAWFRTWHKICGSQWTCVDLKAFDDGAKMLHPDCVIMQIMPSC